MSGESSPEESPRQIEMLNVSRMMSENGSFGPGSFVWFPEGEVMEHGASQDGDVTVVFITNKSFRIDYV